MLITSIGDFGKKGFYNAQEIGLAKALDSLVDEVKVYKLVSADMENSIEAIEGCRNSKIQYIPANKIGANGMPSMKMLDSSLDILVFFSDTQLAVPSVYRWAVRNKIYFFPYIGVAESHSTNRAKQIVMDFLFRRNIKVYRECRCLVKSPAVGMQLKQQGVERVTIAPVGLDVSILHEDYEKCDPVMLKRKHGYQQNDKILLFIGRLTEEKQPIKMIQIYADIAKKDARYKLLMVGMGELKDEIIQCIDELGVSRGIRLIDRISNCDIWELYRFADAFVNLNQQEIFGMAILEAMYYGCKVVAWKAPGPDFIIKDGISGFLVDSDDRAVDLVLNGEIDSVSAHKRVMDCFTWDIAANKIVTLTDGANERSTINGLSLIHI